MSFNKPVSVGDNGENLDGPILAMFKDYIEDVKENHRKTLAEHRYHMRQMIAKSHPVYAPQFASGAIDSSGNLVLDMGGPQQGRRWVVRMVTISDSQSFWNTMGAAKVTLCVGQKTGNTVLPNQVRWPFSSAPNSATFSADQMWIVPSDNVLLSVTGGTSAQSVQAVIWIQDFDEMAGAVREGV